MSKTNIIRVTVAIVILGICAYLLFRPSSPKPLAIGDHPPEFSVPTLAAGSLDLNAYHGHVVVLNLWATWCPPCVEETPSLERFAEKVGSHDIAVLGLSVDDDSKALQAFVQQNHISYPIGRDPDQSLSARLGTVQFPETYIFDRRGRLAEKVIGAIDWDDPRIENFVRSLAGVSNP